MMTGAEGGPHLHDLVEGLAEAGEEGLWRGDDNSTCGCVVVGDGRPLDSCAQHHSALSLPSQLKSSSISKY